MYLLRAIFPRPRAVTAMSGLPMAVRVRGGWGWGVPPGGSRVQRGAHARVFLVSRVRAYVGAHPCCVGWGRKGAARGVVGVPVS